MEERIHGYILKKPLVDRSVPSISCQGVESVFQTAECPAIFYCAVPAYSRTVITFAFLLWPYTVSVYCYRKSASKFRFFFMKTPTLVAAREMEVNSLRIENGTADINRAARNVIPPNEKILCETPLPADSYPYCSIFPPQNSKGFVSSTGTIRCHFRRARLPIGRIAK